jgi:hypothetical protein
MTALAKVRITAFGEADIRHATRNLGAKFAKLAEDSALGPGRDAIESKIVPNSYAQIVSPVHSKQYQIFCTRAAANPFLYLGDLRVLWTCTAWLSVRKVGRFGVPVRSPLDYVNR